MNRLVYKRSGTVTADTQWELDALDLSQSDQLEVHLEVTGSVTGTSPTLNVYLQSRNESGLWEDRVAFTQLSGTGLSGEALKAILQKFGTLSDDEEESEPSGSASASRLTAGTVKNGGFPRPYRRGNVTGATGDRTQMPATAWRFDLDVGGTTPSFPIELLVFAD